MRKRSVLDWLVTPWLVAVIAGVAALPASVAASSRSSDRDLSGTSPTIDLGAALTRDGAFRGAGGISGSVDMSAWTLVSDLARGDAPRFAPASVAPNASGFNNHVEAIAVVGTDLYVGGSFVDGAGIPEADSVARWNGTSWSSLGSNGAGNGALNAWVGALAAYGTDLIVGGSFENAAGIAAADRIARWSGTAWSALGSLDGNGALSGYVDALGVAGGDVFVGGGFINAAGIAEADKIAKWDGSNWSAVGSNGFGNGALNNDVYGLAVSGSNVYVAGEFIDAAGVQEADRVARWDGSNWSALGSNGGGDGALNSYALAVAISGSNIYVGGDFTDAGGAPTADYVAVFNGTSWAGLGSNGSGDGAFTSGVWTLGIYGGDLIVGGGFTNAAGLPAADYIARWNGGSWSALGSNGAGNGALNGDVARILASGTKLYAGGYFTQAAGNTDAVRFAVWDGSAWSAVVSAPARKPDGRIRKGSAAYVGNNVYNSDGTNQTRSAGRARGDSVTFGVSIQNDGAASDRFKVSAAGNAAGYRVRYFRGTTEITAAVLAGTYQTPSLAPGATYLIKAKVKVLSTATAGSSVTRLVTLRSVADPAKVDVVKFIVTRA